MYRYMYLFLFVTVLVGNTIAIAEDGRSYQYGNKEASRLTRKADITHNSDKTRETGQAHTYGHMKRNTELTASRVLSTDTLPDHFPMSTQSTKTSQVSQLAIQGIKRRIHRSFANATIPTPVDITNLFEDKSKANVDITHSVEGGGVPRDRLAMSTSTSPKQASSAIDSILLNESTKSQPVAHLVEGGGEALDKSIISSTVSLPTLSTSERIDDNLDVNPDEIQTSTATDDPKLHKTVPRKGAQVTKIFGRNGVDDINFDARPINADSSSLSLPLATNFTKKEDLPSQQVSPSNGTSSLPSSDGKEDVIESNPPLKKKPNPKPLTLSDKTSFDIPPVPHDHVSSQRDLVIPVVGLILAVPLITILGIFLYKKGSEYWSRRHYRRMDFLIDGMYND